MPLLDRPVVWGSTESNVTAPATAMGTVVTADTTIHTKNATYTTLIASTAADAYGIWVLGSNVLTAATATSILCDIAVGAASSETVIIPNLNFGGADTTTAGIGGGQQYYFPLFIPAGSRISATAQSLISADTVAITVVLYEQPSQPVWAGALVTDYGTTLGSSLGTAVAAGVSGAEGTYTQITASTTYGHRYLAVGPGLNADTTIQGDVCFIDVGVGAATESTILTNGLYTTTNNESIRGHGPIGAYCNIPAATRLAARISKSTSGAESHDVILYGVS